MDIYVYGLWNSYYFLSLLMTIILFILKQNTIAQQPPLTIAPAPLNVEVALRPVEQRWLENMSKTFSFDNIEYDRPFLLDDMISILQPLQPERIE